MTSPAVWGPSADSSRLAVQLHWRLYHRSWCASDWREAFECQPRRQWRGRSRQPGEETTPGWQVTTSLVHAPRNRYLLLPYNRVATFQTLEIPWLFLENFWHRNTGNENETSLHELKPTLENVLLSVHMSAKRTNAINNSGKMSIFPVKTHHQVRLFSWPSSKSANYPAFLILWNQAAILRGGSRKMSGKR